MVLTPAKENPGDLVFAKFSSEDSGLCLSTRNSQEEEVSRWAAVQAQPSFFSDQWLHHRADLADQHNTDLLLVPGDGQGIEVHSPIVLPQSEVLTSLLLPNSSDQVSTILLPQVDRVTVLQMLALLYHGQCLISHGDFDKLSCLLTNLGFTQMLKAVSLNSHKTGSFDEGKSRDGLEEKNDDGDHFDKRGAEFNNNQSIDVPFNEYENDPKFLLENDLNLSSDSFESVVNQETVASSSGLLTGETFTSEADTMTGDLVGDYSERNAGIIDRVKKYSINTPEKKVSRPFFGTTDPSSSESESENIIIPSCSQRTKSPEKEKLVYNALKQGHSRVKCSVCGIFTSYKNYARHCRNCHPDVSNLTKKCESCYKMVDSCNLEFHQRICELISCTFCSKRLSTKGNLKRHVKICPKKEEVEPKENADKVLDKDEVTIARARIQFVMGETSLQLGQRDPNKTILKSFRFFSKKIAVDMKSLCFKHKKMVLSGSELAYGFDGEVIDVQKI
eukprot:GFUD01043149.1.p1 GENE.GFUD01043149.1~~GFUD01043149.1.p1  ORF type:complete len:529 (-),score=131.32 GFUD01043149.1:23-1531(-)